MVDEEIKGPYGLLTWILSWAILIFGAIGIYNTGDPVFAVFVLVGVICLGIIWGSIAITRRYERQRVKLVLERNALQEKILLDLTAKVEEQKQKIKELEDILIKRNLPDEKG